MEMAKVMNKPSRITAISSRAESAEAPKPPALAIKNMVIMEISMGSRPLQGTKLFVRMAIRRSRGESMIRHPTTPAALQPNPISVVKDCFPQAPHF